MNGVQLPVRRRRVEVEQVGDGRSILKTSAHQIDIAVDDFAPPSKPAFVVRAGDSVAARGVRNQKLLERTTVDAGVVASVFFAVAGRRDINGTDVVVPAAGGAVFVARQNRGHADAATWLELLAASPSAVGGNVPGAARKVDGDVGDGAGCVFWRCVGARHLLLIEARFTDAIGASGTWLNAASVGAAATGVSGVGARRVVAGGVSGAHVRPAARNSPEQHKSGQNGPKRSLKVHSSATLVTLRLPG